MTNDHRSLKGKLTFPKEKNITLFNSTDLDFNFPPIITNLNNCTESISAKSHSLFYDSTNFPLNTGSTRQILIKLKSRTTKYGINICHAKEGNLRTNTTIVSRDLSRCLNVLFPEAVKRLSFSLKGNLKEGAQKINAPHESSSCKIKHKTAPPPPSLGLVLDGFLKKTRRREWGKKKRKQ